MGGLFLNVDKDSTSSELVMTPTISLNPTVRFLAFCFMMIVPLGLQATNNDAQALESFVLKNPKIAMTQFLSHPALDQVAQGVFSVLDKAGLKDIQLDLTNANGDVFIAQQIAHRIAVSDVDLAITISTISTQSVVSQLRGGKPVFFGAITVPSTLKLDHMPEVVGVSDYPPLKIQVELIQELIPTLKTIAVIYNPGEDNSTAILKDLTELLAQKDLKLEAIPLEKLQNLPDAVARAAQNAQAIYIVNDNLVASGFPSLIKQAKRHKIPVFSADIEHVKLGAVAMIGYDYFDLGQVLGTKVLEFLKTGKLVEPKIETLSQSSLKPKLYVNKESAQAFGIALNESFLKKADKVY